jgi:hypothetical protein
LVVVEKHAAAPVELDAIMSATTSTERVLGLMSPVPSSWRPSMAPPLFVRESTAEQARRLRRQADAYDQLLGRRMAERGEPPQDFEVAGELPDEETVLIDTALYHAAAERTAQARALVRRERRAVALGAALAVAVAAARRFG